MIRVSIVGARGRMGSTVVDAVGRAGDMTLSQSVDAGGDLASITADNTDVAVEFTVPSASRKNVLGLIKSGVNVVVGTTGWDEDGLDAVRGALGSSDHTGQSVVIAPNYALSAVLMERFAAQAARYFESAEIVEMHHPDKVDAPSGTALHTAHVVAQARADAGLGPMPDATTGQAESRGQVIDGVHVHAVRLRGLNAHEEVLLGNQGEQLMLRADSFDRSSFMPGVLMAVRSAASGNRPGLTVGLGALLD
ncbi:4-hydroxy-tetrahydrodipicolinate reductase [uncultured Bifidobacterium sp.]|uniref:4-hydroxy-tetrahydrodipicolinate reductase n=1 Tax=uncultured Bifidobacterium sp. TaxID=165187 RepID=UPI0026315B95|nr:4-hydroxy-tetrahydrodipicolinate reductase [uncultured Bifidobacterium sp.]